MVVQCTTNAQRRVPYGAANTARDVEMSPSLLSPSEKQKPSSRPLIQIDLQDCGLGHSCKATPQSQARQSKPGSHLCIGVDCALDTAHAPTTLLDAR